MVNRRSRVATIVSKKTMIGVGPVTQCSRERRFALISAVLKKAVFAGAMGPAFVAHEAKTRIMGVKTLDSFCPEPFRGVGLEIGGPSAIFRRGDILPVYDAAQRVDNVTFARETRWEGNVGAGENFEFDRRKAPGTQFILDGGDLAELPAQAYDFVVSSHMLEHSANPLKVLQSWNRVLKPEGALLLVLPHRDSSFDHRRPITTIDHLVSDFEHDRGEDDTTHFEEILALHDLRRDPGQQSSEALEIWVRSNSKNRGAHHHVFDLRVSIEMMSWSGYQVRDAESVLPMHIVVRATKAADGCASNERFLNRSRHAFRSSPFSSDRNSG